MTKLMDLKIDFAFKQVFGKAGNEPILRAFLNAALQLPKERQITSVKILNPEINREYIEDKASVLDIHAKTEQGEHVNIEIQLTNKFDMEKRTLYYWSRIYSAQMQKGMPYTELVKTITINILNFRFLQETDRFHTIFHLYEDQEQFLLTDVLEIHFMEIPKLMDKWEQRTVNPYNNELERWLLLLEADDHEEIRKVLEVIAMRDPVMKRVFDEWEDLSRDEKKWVEYESRRKAILDEMAAVREAEIRQQRAREEGLAEGRTEGERQKAIQMAKKMLAKGKDVEEIVEFTELSVEEIEKLKQQLH
ncbi:Rpn family recombination-promoting nuclease/putative transposase [Brevibacillus massiliensis]|uniref:Rpn family recombination-promoting nuclease/putative transposase n=1 Tax=Brevibacillus massiliensis TaxID=1118054 RepID=UPI00031C316E|nr:Rpn family recombination-promoting nuclease/putative transposase [Brevibacillus massiliensis]